MFVIENTPTLGVSDMSEETTEAGTGKSPFHQIFV